MAHSTGPLGQRLTEAPAPLNEGASSASSNKTLLDSLEQAYRGASLSPVDKIRAIFERSPKQFAQLVRNLSVQLLKTRQLSVLDAVIMDDDIHTSDMRWVPNTRRLALLAMQKGVAQDLELVLYSGHPDVRAEVLSVWRRS